MTPADLSRCVVRAVRCAVEDGELPAAVVVPERVVVERTRPGGVGDYASPVAFQVAKGVGGAGFPPRGVADVLARRLGAEPGIESVEVTGAGFLNFVLPAVSAPDVVRDVASRDLRVAAALLAEGEGDAGGLRETVVRRCVLRLLRVQGGHARELPGDFFVAPLAKRDSDVVDRYGADAAVWGMVVVPARETPQFDDRLLVQGEANEFFRVRYAYARSRALSRNAEQIGFRAEAEAEAEAGDVDGAGDAGDSAGAAALVRALADFPLALEAAAHHRAPERLARYLVEPADALLDFQHRVLPKGDEKPSAAHRARLALAEAAGTVLAGGLALLGMDAPERL
ncbi:ArgS-related anticodon-binding protein NrtL [Streptomyces sp. NPDC056367]|uniref:ArgS-related anticodon-binding protein NrtL n=1 Tax=unclassified Streptomyces TaxID=2593676 RepID=UPI0035DF5E98